ncbi:MAG: MBL fold metallo-hydrolase [Dehalococcoidia bacterium]|nr:MAG: MBL fold metallo-hydrolase [Dehalococcoidia bacterium]
MPQEQTATAEPAVLPGIVRLRFVDERNFAVSAYLLTGDDGCVLVDSGFAGEAAAAALEAQLRSVGRTLGDISTIVLTHLHHDHVGQALRLAERGVTIRYHPAEPSLIAYPFEERLAGLRELLRAHGTPEDDLPDRPYEPELRLDDPIEDGSVLDLAGQRWLAIQTPGHTIGHLCLFRPDDGALIVGDHLLASISTYVGADSAAGPDIVHRFLDSLDRLDTLSATTVLPAHGRVYHDLRGRTAAQRADYAARLDAVAALLDSTPRSAYAVAHALRERRGKSWEIGAFRRALLARHAAALLDELARVGRAERIDAPGAIRYRARSRSDATGSAAMSRSTVPPSGNASTARMSASGVRQAGSPAKLQQ